MIDRRYVGACVMTVGGAITVVATFLPWLRSGARGRSSYELVDLVDRLGFSPGGWQDWSLHLWPLAPLMIVLSVIATWVSLMRPRFIGWAIACTVGTLTWVAGTALGVRSARDVALFRAGNGLWIALIGCVVIVLGAVMAHARGSGVTRASRPARSARL